VNILARYVSWTESLLENKLLLAVFIAINLAGFVVGVETYREAMRNTPAYLWILLVDCPIYPAIMVFILIFRKERFVQKFSFLALYGLIKYGMWTITAWSIYYLNLLGLTFNTIIFLGHFGMILEAGFVARRAAQSHGIEITLPIAWMILNDFSDYALGTHPPLPDDHYLWLLLLQNVILDVVIPLALFAWARERLDDKSPQGMKFNSRNHDK
jgi:uncharacterized membrane protein YpjA